MSERDQAEGVAFRLGFPTDVEAAIDVWRAANPGEGEDHPRRLREWASLPDAMLVVGGQGGRIVAAVLALPGREDDGAGELIPCLLHLTGFCVDPTQQGHGVGAGLLAYLLANARTVGYDRATLWTHSDNSRARRFFQSHGFERTGRTKTGPDGRETVHYQRPITEPH